MGTEKKKGLLTATKHTENESKSTQKTGAVPSSAIVTHTSRIVTINQPKEKK